MMYAVPTVPEMPRLSNVTTPFTAVAVRVPTKAAPVPTVAVTTVVLSEVTMLPPLSCSETRG